MVRINGHFGIGEAAYVPALISHDGLSITRRISFLLDTGASRTIILDGDARALNLPYESLQRYQPGIIGIRGAGMAPIQNVEDAVRAAERFLSRYYSFRTLKTVRKENADWYLEFDVGILSTEIVSMTIEGATGAVTSYRVDLKK